MTTKGWLVLAALAGGTWMVANKASGCLNQPAPDEKLAAHFDDLCEIARDHVAKPEKGVRKMGRYMVGNTGPMLGSLGSTIALIERIPDDEEHDARARLARERMQAPLRACRDEWGKFFDAVENDEKASALLEEAMERLSRTLEIIFSSKGWTLRDLPQQLVDAVEPR